jgi:hypothetical protein
MSWVIGIHRADFWIWVYEGGVAAFIHPNPGTSTAILTEPVSCNDQFHARMIK